jgi:hypothetical protein
VLSARGLDGVKIAARLGASYVTSPATDVVPGPVNVNVVAFMVAGFIAALNVATAMLLGHIPFVPSGGPTEITLGGPGWQVVLPVVKLDTISLARALPNVSTAPVVIVAMKTVFNARVLVGVKMAVWLDAL